MMIFKIGLFRSSWISAEGPTTIALRDKGVDGVKFKDIIGALGMFDSGTLTCRGDTPPTNMDEVGV